MKGNVFLCFHRFFGSIKNDDKNHSKKCSSCKPGLFKSNVKQHYSVSFCSADFCRVHKLLEFDLCHHILPITIIQIPSLSGGEGYLKKECKEIYHTTGKVILMRATIKQG